MNKTRKIPTTRSSRTIEQNREVAKEQIAARAFEKWQQRGCPLWDDAHDWFDAKRELEKDLGGIPGKILDRVA